MRRPRKDRCAARRHHAQPECPRRTEKPLRKIEEVDDFITSAYADSHERELQLAFGIVGADAARNVYHAPARRRLELPWRERRRQPGKPA